jgi:hypothetical protein
MSDDLDWVYESQGDLVVDEHGSFTTHRNSRTNRFRIRCFRFSDWEGTGDTQFAVWEEARREIDRRKASGTLPPQLTD